MSNANTLQYGDIGAVIELTVRENGTIVDVSTASPKQIIIRYPNGETATKTAAFVNSGTDGKIKYTTVSGDISMIGEYQVQGSMTIGSRVFKTTIGSFTVLPNIA